MSKQKNGRLALAKTILFGFVMAIGSISGAHALDGSMLEDADMHVGPGEGFPIVGSAPKDAGLRINGCIPEDGWCLVRHGGRHGWVPSASVRLIGITRSTNQLPEPIIVIDATYHHYGAVIGSRRGYARHFRSGRTPRGYVGRGYSHRSSYYRRTGRSIRNRRYRSYIGGSRDIRRHFRNR